MTSKHKNDAVCMPPSIITGYIEFGMPLSQLLERKVVVCGKLCEAVACCRLYPRQMRVYGNMRERPKPSPISNRCYALSKQWRACITPSIHHFEGSQLHVDITTLFRRAPCHRFTNCARVHGTGTPAYHIITHVAAHNTRYSNRSGYLRGSDASPF